VLAYTAAAIPTVVDPILYVYQGLKVIASGRWQRITTTLAEYSIDDEDSTVSHNREVQKY
jgi:hypothetical protein